MRLRPRHFERLLAFLTRKGRSPEDAEDLIQEAMLRLHVHGQDSAIANEEAFLRHAVVNLSIDQYRRERPDLRHKVPLEDLDGVPSLAPPLGGPEEALDAEQRLKQIGQLLDSSSRRTREIYFAHRAGYSYDEISRHLGISHITIRRHIARALLLIVESAL